MIAKSGVTESVILELQRATHATLGTITAQLASLDLTASEINALANLADGASRTVSTLAAAVGARPTTLTGVLDRLERRGLITRGSRPGDRRAVVVELTATGNDTAAVIRRTLDALERRALAGINARVVAQARTVLRALSEVGR